MCRKLLIILTGVLFLQVGIVRAAEIIVVTEDIDRDWDGLRDDHSLESFLISEGHDVTVRPDYWDVLTPDKIAELNAADLIIVSRLAWSTRYNQGNEPTEWNSITTPLLQMNSHFARNSRWNWVNSGAIDPDGTSYNYAEAVDPYHPVFRGVLTAHEPTGPDGPLDIIEIIDPLVGTGFTAFIDGTDMGNGRLIAKPFGLDMGWIAEWEVGVEFYDGAGQYTGGKRMLFCAGTREIQYYDEDRQVVITTAQGELNLTAEGLQMFRNAINYLLGGADIILVTEAIDWDMDGLRDDHSLESFLISEGHNVDIRPDYWKVLTPEKITELNAADLIIFSRLAWSDHYDDGDETIQWNSITTPLLQMSAYFARNTEPRWNWVNSGVKERTPLIYAQAVDPHHPIFRGVLLTAFEPSNPDSPANIVQMIDPLVGTGLTSFINTTNMGNGHLIAKPVQAGMGWIAEWDVGVEFYEGSGQYAGGRRMLFCAGTQEIQFVDPDTQEVMTTAQGELNLTAEGLQMFRNAIDYMVSPRPEFTEGVVEDFETEDFSKFPWSSYGDESWETTRSERHSGNYSARSGSIEDGEESSLEVSINCVSGYITFYCKVSCESGFDKLTFYIDGLEQDTWSGQEDWAEVSFQVREGIRTFKWAYSKDSSISEGDDTVWIDDIIFPIGL